MADCDLPLQYQQADANSAQAAAGRHGTPQPQLQQPQRHKQYLFAAQLGLQVRLHQQL